MQFFEDIRDVAKTRKFWTAALGFVLLYLSDNYADRGWVQIVISLATLFGIYQVPNKVGAVSRKA